MTIHDFIHLLESKKGKSAKKSGHGYTALCPAHDDSTPSLSINEGEDGRILLNCFSGCKTEDVCASLGMTITDLFPEKFTKHKESVKNRIEYPYRDENGVVLYTKIRIEPGFNGKSKSFYWERVNEQGVIVKNLNDCRKTLYRLPEVLKAAQEGQTIFIVEGEKDADKLVQHGLVATTAPEALKWPDEFTTVLCNSDVAILYDMDETGIKRKELLCTTLNGKVKRLRVIDLPDLAYQNSHGKDVSDWLSEGHTVDQLLEILASSSDYSPSKAKSKIRVVTIEEFLQMNLPPREMILFPFLPTQGLCLVHAKRGVGKTHVALEIACAAATGSHFLKWYAIRPVKTLYVDGEMSATDIQKRLRKIFISQNRILPDPTYLRLITPDLQEDAMPDLSTKAGQKAFEKIIQDSELIIIDNISTLFRSSKENDADGWQTAQDWGLELRRRGKSVLFVHHDGKAGEQRGTSKREDTLDSVLALKHPPKYSASQGAVFTVIFEKTRQFLGKDAEPFQARLKDPEDGLREWHVEAATIDAIDPEIQQIAGLVKEGLTIEEIRVRTGLSKSKIETRKKKAKDQGLI